MPEKNSQKAATISDVAAAAGVSKTSVSRYLNGKYEFFSKETKEKIGQVIQTLDYRPSRAARTLKTKRTGMIGCIVDDILSPFSSIIIKGVNDICTAEGYQLLIANADSDPEKERNAAESLRSNNVEGIIVNGTGGNNEYFIQLSKSGMPVVLADRGILGNPLDTVTSQNKLSTYNALKHMFKTGIQNVSLFIEDTKAVPTREDRHAGYLEAVEDFAPLPADNKVFIVDVKDPARTEKMLASLLKKPEPRGVFCGNGVVLQHLLLCLKQKKYQIPDDFAVASYDDWDWPAIMSPSITVIWQDSYDVGKRCAKLLLGRIRGEQRGEPLYIETPTELRIRESTNITHLLSKK